MKFASDVDKTAPAFEGAVLSKVKSESFSTAWWKIVLPTTSSF